MARPIITGSIQRPQMNTYLQGGNLNPLWAHPNQQEKWPNRGHLAQAPTTSFDPPGRPTNLSKELAYKTDVANSLQEVGQLVSRGGASHSGLIGSRDARSSNARRGEERVD